MELRVPPYTQIHCFRRAYFSSISLNANSSKLLIFQHKQQLSFKRSDHFQNFTFQSAALRICNVMSTQVEDLINFDLYHTYLTLFISSPETRPPSSRRQQQRLSQIDKIPRDTWQRQGLLRIRGLWIAVLFSPEFKGKKL